MNILAIQNDLSDPPHLVGKWLEEDGHRLTLIKAFAGEEVPSRVPDNIDALLPLGGSMGALDDHIAPWLADERALLADAVVRDIPIFAICLGAQLLAEACGGKVERAEQGEIGVFAIQMTEDAAHDSVFNISGPLLAAQWHEDVVTSLPMGAVQLARSERCENQVFRIGNKIYATQFHPEIDGDTIQTWEEEADNAFISSGKISVEAEVRAAENELIRLWRPVIRRWADVASL